MKNSTTQKEKAQQLRALHHTGKLLVLPNIWDVLGAVLLEHLEYPAIATASAAVAFANGYDDGEKIPFNEVLVLLKKIANSVHVPVTADIESGYAADAAEFEANMRRFIATGIVGINIEDTNNTTHGLNSIEVQCDKIRVIKEVSAELDVPLFINARTDVYIHAKHFTTAKEKFSETLKRGLAYKAAGADCFFPLALTQEQDIQQLVAQLNMPVNILALPGIPDLETLQNIGVARVSLGPSFLKIAIKAMRATALQLRENKGLAAVTENEITSDYLRSLVNKQHG